jgi:hypothetical protein
MEMTLEQYETRARAIDTWARAQYAAGKMSEAAVERRVEAMFDALDDEYMPGRHAGFTGAQSYSDFVEG